MRYGRKVIPFVLALFLMIGFESNGAQSRLQSVTQLNDKEYTIAVETGTITEGEVKKVLPDAGYIFVNSASEG